MEGQSGFQQTGFQEEGFSQGGFQQTYTVTQYDIDSLRSSLENAGPQIAQALQVLQKFGQNTGSQGFQSNDQQATNQGFDPKNHQLPETFENKGFQPPEQTVTLLESDAAALKSAVGMVFSYIDGANRIIGKPEFGPGGWSSGFRDVTK